MEDVDFKKEGRCAEKNTGMARIAGSERGENIRISCLMPELRGACPIPRQPVLLC
jgi:hypothetical protein